MLDQQLTGVRIERSDTRSFDTPEGVDVRYEIVGDTAVFLLENPKSERSLRRNVSFAGVTMDRASICRLLDAVWRLSRGQSLASQESFIRSFLKPFAAFFRQCEQKYPADTAAWQKLLFDFLRFYLLDQTHSKMSVPNRIQQWKGAVRPALAFLIEERIVPLGVEIPRVNSRREPLAGAVPALLGRRALARPDRRTPRQKLLVNVEFALDDADYLARIEHECRLRIATLRSVCLKHWSAMQADHRTGTALARTIPEERIEACIRSGQYRRVAPRAFTASPLASPALADGHVWALAVGMRLLRTGPGLDCVSVEMLRASPFFTKEVFNSRPYYDALSRLSALPSGAGELIANTARFYRFLGLLCGVDVAAACCLLMIEHPQFTPSSLQHAQLYDERGRLFLQASTEKSGGIRFSLDKPRAGARKEAVLSALAQEIVTYVTGVTEPIRTLMRNAGHKAWRYLFLGQQEGGYIGPLHQEPTSSLTRDRSSLIRLYPELVEHGLTRGTLDFRRVRNTMGVIRWFETGSLVEMSRRLGNTRQVALTHYLPPALLHAWNARIIRRFQNTLIVLAAHEESYLLEVSDFSSLGDLLQFIAQLLEEHRDGTSPIASELHSRFGEQRNGEGPAGRLLNIRCSAQTLAYLYAFDAYATNLEPAQREHVDSLTGLSAQLFIDLSRMIRHACENPEVENSLREVLDIEALRHCHREALAQEPAMRLTFARFAFNNTWGPTACAA